MFNSQSFVLGNVQFRNLRSQELIDCTQLSHGQLIVDDDIEIIETEHVITFILVVEKDTVFQVIYIRSFSTIEKSLSFAAFA